MTYNFTGTVGPQDFTGNPLGGTFSNGQAVFGTFTFDDSTPDLDGGSDVGFYDGGITSIAVNVGGYLASATGGSAEAYNNFPFDTVGVFAAVNDGPYTGNAIVSGLPVAGLTLGLIGLQLTDTTGVALSNDLFPDPLTLSDFDSVFGRVEFYDPGLGSGQDLFSAVFSIDTLELGTTTALPAPPGLLILLTGLIGLWRLKRNSGYSA